MLENEDALTDLFLIVTDLFLIDPGTLWVVVTGAMLRLVTPVRIAHCPDESRLPRPLTEP